MAILKKPTAHWVFELDSDALNRVGSAELAYLEKFLSKLQQCVVIFRQSELFIPSRVALLQWIDIKGEEKIDLGKDVEYVDVECGADIRLDNLIIEKIMCHQYPERAIRPADIEVHGWTRLVGVDGSAQKIANIVSVNGLFMGGGVIDIRVFGDVWLPFSLDGKSRNASYEKNANMLEMALNEVERSFGVEPIFDDASDFCRIDGYRLENFMGEDGNIIGVDKLGRVL
jgi:hypothetical protein